MRDLVQDRTRLFLSVAGVALAVMLVLLLSGFVDGIDRQVGQFADRTPGSIVVAQADVSTLLVATSTLPPRAEQAAREVTGVADVVPVISRITVLDLHGKSLAAYLIGYDPARGGGPWRIAEGREAESDDEIVIDRSIANLDSKIGHEIMRRLRSIAKDQGRSIVIVSHDQRIEDIADRVLWLEDGEFKEVTAVEAEASRLHRDALRETVRPEATLAGTPK